MARKTPMQKLLASYDLSNENDYYEMVCISHINGQKKQAAEQFKAMPLVNRKALVKGIVFDNEGVFDKDLKMFFFDLL